MFLTLTAAAVRADAAGAGAAPFADPDSTNSPAACLRAVCDGIVARQQENGLFAPTAGPWWEVSFQIRVLLAGGTILEEPRYREAACRAVARFVQTQASDGGWCAFHPDSSGEVPSCDSRNLADLGTITACLSLTAPYLATPEREAALQAHRAYIDRFAKRWDRPDGGYANGLYASVSEEATYSVATATQAVSLIALYRATGDASTMRRAEAAARALTAGWFGDGRPLLRPHDRPTPRVTQTKDFGDLYYVIEALLWVDAATDDAALHETIRKVLRVYLFGRRGLVRSAPEDGWFAPPSEPTNGCKANGMPGILLSARQRLGNAEGPDGTVEDDKDDKDDMDEMDDRALAVMAGEGLRRLCDPATRGAYGVLMPAPDRLGPGGSACELFAAISIAESIRPGICLAPPPPARN
jgi:hypothetical protein